MLTGHPVDILASNCATMYQTRLAGHGSDCAQPSAAVNRRSHPFLFLPQQKFLSGSGVGGGGSKSALLGDFKEVAQPAAAAAQPAGADAAASNATPPQTSAAPQCVLFCSSVFRRHEPDADLTSCRRGISADLQCC